MLSEKLFPPVLLFAAAALLGLFAAWICFQESWFVASNFIMFLAGMNAAYFSAHVIPWYFLRGFERRDLDVMLDERARDLVTDHGRSRGHQASAIVSRLRSDSASRDK